MLKTKREVVLVRKPGPKGQVHFASGRPIHSDETKSRVEQKRIKTGSESSGMHVRYFKIECREKGSLMLLV